LDFGAECKSFSIFYSVLLFSFTCVFDPVFFLGAKLEQILPKIWAIQLFFETLGSLKKSFAKKFNSILRT